MFHCFKDLEQAQKGSSPSSPWPYSTHKYKTNGEDEVLIFAKLTFWWPISWVCGVKKMFLVPKTLINLLLLNSNNLTHWSRERPICFLWGSVNFSARADSVIRDDGRGGGWNQDIWCNQIFSLRGHGWGKPKPSRRNTAPNNSGLSIMWGCGVRFPRLWLDSANIYWVPTTRGI